MSSTTIEHPMSVSTNNPFEAARKLAEQREQEEAAEASRLAEVRRIEREQHEAELQKERELRKAAAKQEEFVMNAKRWILDFFSAVAKTAIDRGWKATAIVDTKTYAEALVRQSDQPLPKIDPGIAKVIHSKFAYGLALDHKRRQIIPENFFNGQRQDWFPALYERKLTEAH